MARERGRASVITDQGRESGGEGRGVGLRDKACSSCVWLAGGPPRFASSDNGSMTHPSELTYATGNIQRKMSMRSRVS